MVSIAKYSFRKRGPLGKEMDAIKQNIVMQKAETVAPSWRTCILMFKH
jgi:DNA-binding XRE family transcriptional regulator